MSIIKRAISADGSVVASAIDATDMVAMIEQYHKPSAVVTAALGRLTIAASLMGYGLKSADESLTLRIDGDGPIGAMVACADDLLILLKHPQYFALPSLVKQHQMMDHIQ